MDTQSRQVIAFHVGDRSRKSAKRLWAKIPEAYRQQARFTHDQYVGVRGDSRCSAPGDQQVGPQNQSHRALQQHAPPAAFHAWYARRYRFPRSSRTIIGAIKLFICHYTSRELRRRASITWNITTDTAVLALQ